MEKWTIKPAPTSSDPRRHVLLLKGDMKDVSMLVKRFGSMCGRPTRENGAEGFNFSLFLHGLNEASLQSVRAALGELGGPPALASLAPVAAPKPLEFAPPPPLKLEPAAALPPPPPLPDLPLPPAPAAPAASPLQFEAPPPPPPPLAELPSPPPVAPAPSPAPVTPPPEPVAPAPAAAAPVAQPVFGLMSSIDGARGFESLAVGAYNRFAHAAATSVIGAPGSMYNPLFLYGPPGVGKTHMAQAIAQGLMGALGKENVILTSGPRLSRAVSLSLAAQRFGEIETAIAAAKALVVDDLHLLALTDVNTGALAKVFSAFFGSNLQVVLTSMYPPRALGALEEALRISFGKGWSVDLKVPGAPVQREIVQTQFDRAGMTMNNEEISAFIERMGANYGEASVWVRRIAMFHRASQQSGQNAKPNELMAAVFNPDPAASGQEMPGAQQLASVKGFHPPAPGPTAVNLVVILPKLHESLGEWVIARFYQAGGQFRIQQTYRHVGIETYDAQQPFGVPFQIGDICQRTAAQVAVIVGPPGDSQLAARAGEFSHAVGRILDSLGVRMGWVPHNGTMSGANFLRAQLDCAPD